MNYDFKTGFMQTFIYENFAVGVVNSNASMVAMHSIINKEFTTGAMHIFIHKDLTTIFIHNNEEKDFMIIVVHSFSVCFISCFTVVYPYYDM